MRSLRRQNLPEIQVNDANKCTLVSRKRAKSALNAKLLRDTNLGEEVPVSVIDGLNRGGWHTTLTWKSQCN